MQMQVATYGLAHHVTKRMALKLQFLARLKNNVLQKRSRVYAKRMLVLPKDLNYYVCFQRYMLAFFLKWSRYLNQNLKIRLLVRQIFQYL